MFVTKITHNYFYKLLNILHNFSLSQVVHSPTHANSNGHASLIQLALVSNKTKFLDCSVILPLANADHTGLELLKWKHYETQVRLTSRTIWRYKDADFAKACQMIDKMEWDGLLHEDNVDRSAINWNNKFMEVKSTYIPQQSLKRRRNVPWLTKNISQHIRMCNAAFQVARKFAKPVQFFKYEKLTKVVTMVRSAKSSYFKNLNRRNKKHFGKP